MAERNIMTVDEVAEYLQIGRRSIYRLVKSGELPGHKVLNRWRFLRRDIEAWLESVRVNEMPQTSPQGFDNQESAADESMSTTEYSRKNKLPSEE